MLGTKCQIYRVNCLSLFHFCSSSVALPDCLQWKLSPPTCVGTFRMWEQEKSYRTRAAKCGWGANITTLRKTSSTGCQRSSLFSDLRQTNGERWFYRKTIGGFSALHALARSHSIFVVPADVLSSRFLLSKNCPIRHLTMAKNARVFMTERPGKSSFLEASMFWQHLVGQFVDDIEE